MSDAEVAAFIVGLTEVIKKTGILPSQFCPLFAIIGAAIVCGVDAFSKNAEQTAIYEAVIRGTIIGVTSTGMYSVTDRMISKTVGTKESMITSTIPQTQKHTLNT